MSRYNINIPVREIQNENDDDDDNGDVLVVDERGNIIE